MKIKGTTSSYCKVKDIKISGFKAYIYLIITSLTAQENTCVFSFYIRDLITQEFLKASNNNYWIDRCNNYENNMSNIDINKYKEIMLEVDITNNNTADMQGNKWVRNIELVLVNNRTQEECWTSESLELISKEISLPEITSFFITKDSKNNTQVCFTLNYPTQEDFNYINNNLITKLDVTSCYTKLLLESFTIPNGVNKFTLPLEGKYTEPVDISIRIQNLKEEDLITKTKFYNPEHSLNQLAVYKKSAVRVIRGTVKTSTGLSNVIKIN